MAIVGIGTVVVDHVVELPQYPQSDTKVEILSDWQQLGGPVPVALSTAAHFGAGCAFLGRCGDDGNGKFVRRVFSERGIEFVTGPADAQDDWATGFAQVWVEPTGERTIAYSRGRFPVLTADDVPPRLVETAAVLHLDGWSVEGAIAAAQRVKAGGGKVVLDAGSVKPGLPRLLPLVDVLIASELFRRSYFGAGRVTERQLLALGPADVLTTDGAQGAAWIRRDGREHVDAIAVDAVDTNGAGDVFAGAVVFGLDAGWDSSAILRFANEVAGYSCGFRGNSALPVPSLARLAGDGRTPGGSSSADHSR